MSSVFLSLWNLQEPVSCSWFKSQVVVLMYRKHSVTIHAEPISVQIGNLYVQNDLPGNWVGTGFTTPIIMAVQTFEVVHQSRSPEKGLHLRHLLGLWYGTVLTGKVRSLKSSSPLSIYLITSVHCPELFISCGTFLKQLKCQICYLLIQVNSLMRNFLKMYLFLLFSCMSALHVHLYAWKGHEIPL